MSDQEDREKFEWIEAPRAEASKFYRRYGSKIRISREDFTVVACVQIKLGGRACHGVMSQDGYIYVNIKEDEAVETLLHEIIHGEIHHSGLRQTSGWNGDTEEIICEIISRAIAGQFNLQKKSGPALRRSRQRQSRLR